jgi:acyl-CoA reductase-like NAD-dependent aldehyde dehydrogenase
MSQAIEPVARLGPRKACADSLTDCRAAQAAWAAWPLTRRLAVVRRLRHSLADQGLDLARLAGADRPRSVAETLMAEVVPLADACRFLERQARRLLRPRRVGVFERPAWLWGVRSEVRREPWGVVLIIAPSNFHLFLAGVQTVQAIVAGNAVLWKPAPGGSATADALAGILADCGLPESLLTVLPEAPQAAVEAIDRGVDKVVLTGSAATGQAVLASLAPRLVPAALELSGCDAAFVLDDADLDLTAQALAFSLRFNDSETCIAARRVFVPSSLAAGLEQRLIARLRPRPLAGPAVEAVKPWLREALDEGASLLVGTIAPDGPLVGPIVLTNARPEMRLLSEAPFLPVLAIVRVADEAEALRSATACPYALGASVFGEARHAEALAGRIRAGGVVVNDLIAPTADPRLPFGGQGRSGFGVTRGAEGLLEMTTPKVVSSSRGLHRLHYLPLTDEDDLSTAAAYLRMAHGRKITERLAALARLAGGVLDWVRRSGAAESA